jgi:hypothetical protein
VPEEIKTNRLVFNMIGAGFYDLGCDTQFYQIFRDYGLASKGTLKKAFAIMNSTQILTTSDTLNTVYRVGFEIAHNILRLFWKPTSLVTNQVDFIYEKYFKNNYVIGMQLRYEYLNWIDTFAFIRCARRIQGAAKTKMPVKWFISADNGFFIEQIRKYYPHKVIAATGIITHIDADTNGFERALVDIELLARANEHIITAGSTFGYNFFSKCKTYMHD